MPCGTLCLQMELVSFFNSSAAWVTANMRFTGNHWWVNNCLVKFGISGRLPVDCQEPTSGGYRLGKASLSIARPCQDRTLCQGLKPAAGRRPLAAIVR